MWIDIDKLSKQQLRKIEYIIGKIEMPKIKVKLLNNECMPTRSHRWDAGWDLRAVESVTIYPGETVKVPTGVIFEIPPRHCGMMVARSGLGTKHGITLANDVGIIDTEYRGEVIAALYNSSEDSYKIEAGDRIAQLMIVPINTSELWAVDVVSETERGTGGFGSSDEPKEDLVIKTQENVLTFPDIPIIPTKDAEFERSENIEKLKRLTPAEYMKLKNSDKLFEEYPIATADMKIDLGI